MKLQTDLREFIESLNSRSVEYLVVGGHAVAFHGYPRFSGDIEFFLRPTAANAERVMAVLAEFGFADVGLDVQALTRPNKVIQLGRPPNRIDLLTSISGVGFDEAWRGRVASDYDGLPVCFVGKQTLLANKRASGRAKDLADVEALSEKRRR